MLRILVLLVLLMLSVQPGIAETESDEFFIQLVHKAYVETFRSGDVGVWISSFDEDAVAMHNRRPIDRGRDAIELFGKAVHEHFVLEEYEVNVTDIRRGPGWAYTVGSYTSKFLSRQDGSTPFGREYGKFLLLWEKKDDGTWKIILDTGNANQ